MSTERPTISIYDAVTKEQSVRPMTDEELENYLAEVEEIPLANQP